MDLDPAHLRSFMAIVRYGGYHRAADALHLTQPAVSRHIRRLEEQLGEPLFARRGRGVELTSYGERAADELGDLLAAHDQTVARLQRAGTGAGPFVLGAIENVVDPILPDMLAAMREELGDRQLQLRVDRSLQLVDRVARGEVDAAIVADIGDTPDAIEVGTLTLRWWATPALAALDTPPEPLPLIAYDPPCGLRERALRRLDELELEYELAAESPHLTGVQAAARSGLGYALLAAGGDGLRRVGSGPLAEPVSAPLWLLLRPEHAALAAPVKAALWRATARRALPAAA
ncbi:MAG TPA: LysR family transcriptional regulator [Solirubrobacteraceae bacterium]|nr:LysR family transcriptional regulator [Solirubrobacteraceae bacterium]